MDDVARLHRRLHKFVKGEVNDASEALDILMELDKTKMTLSLLKDTQVGKTVGKLRKHDNAKIAELAKALVKKWKTVAISPTASSGSHGSKTSSPAPSGSSERPTATKGTKAAPSPAAAAPSAPKSNGVKKSSSGPFIPPGLDKMRATVRTKLKEVLEMSEGRNAAADVASAIEIAMGRMFNMGFPGENKKDYSAKFRQLSFNLKKNGALREDLLNDMVNAEQLIQMSSEELATEEKRNEIQKLRDDAFQKARLDWAEANEEKINKQCGLEGTKGLFTCGRCKSTKTSNTQKQTRSADEPMTVFVQCHNCGNRWKC